MQSPDIWQLMSRIPHPDQPFVTVVSDGGRVELSGRTLSNGVAKAANAFRDVLDTEPGDSVVVDLGWTWQQSVWQGAALIAGLKLRESPTENILHITPSLVSTHPLGLPTGAADDITQDVLGQPDSWLYPEYFPEQQSLIDSAREWAAAQGVGKEVSERIGIITADKSDTGAYFFGPFLLPLVTQGSVVFINAHAPEFIDSVVNQEKVTRLLRP
jgi:uncharacterized protein (TIGR03089 family)